MSAGIRGARIGRVLRPNYSQPRQLKVWQLGVLLVLVGWGGVVFAWAVWQWLTGAV